MGSKHSFGGIWTEVKLQAVDDYIGAYLRIFHGNLGAKMLRTTYLDGFAGSGRRYASESAGGQASFAEFDDPDVQEFFKGSAYRVLEHEPGFHNYVFIESKPEFAAELRKLKEQFRNNEHRISVLQGKSNEIIRNWVHSLDKKDRALVFLDPYGMEVDWATIRALGDSEKVDLWVLVPLGQAIIRLLRANQPPPEHWAKSLDRFFGTDQWRERFYRREQSQTLFGDDEEAYSKTADFRAITDFVVERLATCFKGVVKEPIVLFNSVGVPLYLLCFAVSNEKGAPAAIRIASDISRKFNRG